MGPRTIPFLFTVIFSAFSAETVIFIFIWPSPIIDPAGFELIILLDPGSNVDS